MRTVLPAAALALALAAPAGALTAHLLTHPSLLDETPGPDRRIGTGDDVVVSGATTLGSNDSGHNDHAAASFSYLIGSSSAAFPDDSSYDFIVFVDGDVQFAPNLAASTANDLQLDITGGTLRSTPEFSRSTRPEAMTAVTGVIHVNPNSGAGTFRLTGHFTPANEPGADFQLDNQVLSGPTTIVLKSQFGASGNAYLDHLTTLAPATATAFILAEVTGHVTEATHSNWPARGVLAAYTTDALGCTSFLTGVPCATTTTTTLPSACATFPACEPALDAALPAVATAAKKSKATAKRLTALAHGAYAAFGKASGTRGAKQKRFYKKACSSLKSLASLAGKAGAKGRLGADAGAIQSAVTRLRSFIPGC